MGPALSSGFVSAEFEEFLWKHGIRHVTSAPYHPATNGLTEGAVQRVKRGLKKVNKGTTSHRLLNASYAPDQAALLSL